MMLPTSPRDDRPRYSQQIFFNAKRLLQSTKLGKKLHSTAAQSAYNRVFKPMRPKHGAGVRSLGRISQMNASAESHRRMSQPDTSTENKKRISRPYAVALDRHLQILRYPHGFTSGRVGNSH